MFDVALLRTFVSVARLLNFTSAAAELHLSQSTVSKHVRSLELAAGRTLIDRETRSIALTPEGHAMLGFAREILASQDAAATYFRAGSTLSQLRLGVRDGLAFSWMPEAISAFRASHPSVGIEIFTGTDVDLSELLRNGRIDVALMLVFTSEELGHFVARERMAWIHAPQANLSVGGSVPVVAYGRSHPGSGGVFQSLESARVRWHLACMPHDAIAMLAAVRAGLGIALWPEGMIPDGLVRASEDLGLPRFDDFFDVRCIEGARADPDITRNLVEVCRRFARSAAGTVPG